MTTTINTAVATKVLIVEDDPNIVDLIRSNLVIRGFGTVVSAGSKVLALLESERPDMVLLDNMAPEAVRACVSLARATAPAGFLVEVSGGITLDNVRTYADAGADLISTSVITQSAPALDIAFDLRPDAPGAEER